MANIKGLIMHGITDNLSSKMEDYLETIFILKKETGVARVGEIAKSLKVKSSSVNSAVNFLKEHGLVIHEKYGYVRLTKEGDRIASEVKSKHDIFFRFLTEFLMLDPKKAEKEACSIEHAISKETFQRLTKLFKFLEDGFKEGKPRILEKFEIYLKTGKRKKCEREKSCR
ncbi:MAG: metal-dependent transcriptional regulator [Candidatus Aureabacteria bacterium]|nr:metal-dependent transcriptional regulator [Candidatus Auribacterota bacterium]